MSGKHLISGALKTAKKFFLGGDSNERTLFSKCEQLPSPSQDSALPGGESISRFNGNKLHFRTEFSEGSNCAQISFGAKGP